MNLPEEMKSCDRCDRNSDERFFGAGNGKNPEVIFVLDCKPTEKDNLIIYKICDAIGIPKEKCGVLSLVKCGYDPGTIDQIISCSHLAMAQIKRICNNGARPFLFVCSVYTNEVLEFGFYHNYLGSPLGFFLIKSLSHYVEQALLEKINEIF